MMKVIGSRAEVFHCTADHTAGGLRKIDLYLDAKDGQIKSKAAHKAAMDRMKAEGKSHLVKVFKPKDGEFKKQPKQGTQAYKKLIKKMK